MSAVSATAIIADDEPLLRHHLNRALGEVWPELDIVAQAENGRVALSMIEQHQPEVAFIDIRMPEMDGMSLARQLAGLAKPPLIVFITAYDEYAIQAFEANAADYLLKPLSEARLVQCCTKLQLRLAEHSSERQLPDLQTLLQQIQHISQQASPSFLSWLKVQKGEDIHLISVADMLYAKAEDKYLSIYVKSDSGVQEFLLRSSLKELLQQLDPNQFWQIHRSTAVNVAKIDKVKKEFTGKMYVLIGHDKLPVSRALQAQFKS
ncbi:MAG: LytTR family DNA-binding domain-containing protein [Vibrio anguillarum]